MYAPFSFWDFLLREIALILLAEWFLSEYKVSSLLTYLFSISIWTQKLEFFSIRAVFRGSTATNKALFLALDKFIIVH